MTGWQLCRQIRKILREQTWPDSPNEVVFGARVYVSVAVADDQAGRIGFPFALVAPGSAEQDEQSPTLELSSINVVLATAVAGDHVGEAALLGGPRGSSGSGSSRGRGLLELEEALHDAVGTLTGANGVGLRVAWRSAPEARVVAGVGYVVSRGYTLEAVTTRDRSYPAAPRLAATAAGGGAVSLSWALPPDRYDRLRMILRRSSGATAPTGPTDGTGVTLSGDLATSVTDTPGAGTWSYSLFTAYDETGAGSEERYSSAMTRTSIVAT